MFGVEVDDGDGAGGRVIVRVRLEGKSDWVGVLVGMMMELAREIVGELRIAPACLLGASIGQLSLPGALPKLRSWRGKLRRTL